MLYNIIIGGDYIYILVVRYPVLDINYYINSYSKIYIDFAWIYLTLELILGVLLITKDLWSYMIIYIINNLIIDF